MTLFSKKDSVLPCELDLQISTPSSPIASISSEENFILSANSRKRMRVFSDSPDQSVDVEDGVPSCSSRDGTPASISKKSKLVKTEDNAIPLPDPFPLLKHYCADVEVALANGKMTSSFLSAVAASMLVFKRYPTREDYMCCEKCDTKIQLHVFPSKNPICMCSTTCRM